VPARKRPPANVFYPHEFICKWCDGITKRHCERCTWYPCKPCHVITALQGPIQNEAGVWVWSLTYRTPPVQTWVYLSSST